MPFLDWISNRNAAPQQAVAQSPQPQPAPQPSVESLPDHAKAQAVEAARPVARLMEETTTPKPTPPTPSAPRARSRSLGMER
jgi:hypothetical protein